MAFSNPSWQELGDKLTERYARSLWRLPLILIASAMLYFGPLYLLRGMRFVIFGALGIVAIAGSVLAFVYPFHSMLLGMFIQFSGLEVIVPGPVGAFLMSLSLARLVFDALGGKRLDWGSRWFCTSMAVLLVAAIASLMLAWRLDLVLIELRNIVLGSLVYLTLSNWADRPSRIATCFLVLALTLGVACAIPLYGVLAASGFSLVGLALAGRFSGIATDPNIHAGTVNCVIPLLLAVMMRLGGWRRWAVAPLLLLLIVSIVLSQSRAGFIVLGLVLLISLLRARHGPGIVVGALAVLGLIVVFLPEVYWVRFVSLGQFRGIVVDRSLLLRQHAMESAFQVFLSHPWFGVGVNHVRTYAPHYMLGGMMAHNSYLEIAAGLGVVGAVAYAAWLWTGISMARRATRAWRVIGQSAERQLAEGILIGFVAFCVTALTLSITFHMVLWCLFGLANAARRCAVRDAAIALQT